MAKYKYKTYFYFWSIYCKREHDFVGEIYWVCIPPDKKYIPDWYPKGAVVRKHIDDMLPPQSYWLEPEYESIVYFNFRKRLKNNDKNLKMYSFDE